MKTNIRRSARKGKRRTGYLTKSRTHNGRRILRRRRGRGVRTL